tara:strand:+ start:3319 stop:3867 length:549 start_codon:yes stop_codon:yes gene_type:complete
MDIFNSKKKLKIQIQVFYKKYNLSRHKEFLKINKTKLPIVFFDIDNTLANTWPLLQKRKKFNIFKYLQILSFPKVVNLCNEYKLNQHHVFILSARPLRSWFFTYLWLNLKGIKFDKLYLVSSPKDKINFFKTVSNLEIICYDDLSFNHENNDLKLYEDIIKEIKLLPNVRYFGYEFLQSIQK